MNTQDVVAWICEVFEEPVGRISPTTPRQDIANWDSLGTLSLMAELDAKFDIQLTDEEVDGMASVSDILAVLRRHGHLVEA